MSATPEVMAAESMAERRKALAALLYEMAPGAEWFWAEGSRSLDDDSTSVVLIAAVAVRGRDGSVV